MVDGVQRLVGCFSVSRFHSSERERREWNARETPEDGNHVVCELIDKLLCIFGRGFWVLEVLREGIRYLCNQAMRSGADPSRNGLQDALWV